MGKVKILTPDDQKIIDRNIELEEKFRKLEADWQKQVDLCHAAGRSIDETRPLFDKYLKAVNKWKKYWDEHSDILHPKKIG